ncbi:hypothetical protein BO94DRAFT_434194, partial [Aspergillus sclerotioniger CBS 115572]
LLGGRLQQVLELAFLGSGTDSLAALCATRRAFRTGSMTTALSSPPVRCTGFHGWSIIRLHAGICLTASGDILGSFPLPALFVPLSVRCII